MSTSHTEAQFGPLFDLAAGDDLTSWFTQLCAEEQAAALPAFQAPVEMVDPSRKRSADDYTQLQEGEEPRAERRPSSASPACGTPQDALRDLLAVALAAHPDGGRAARADLRAARDRDAAYDRMDASPRSPSSSPSPAPSPSSDATMLHLRSVSTANTSDSRPGPGGIRRWDPPRRFRSRGAVARDPAAGSSSAASRAAAFLRRHGLHHHRPSFTYEQLRAATAGFDAARKLGDGGFGTVFVAYLPPASRPAAVKRLHVPPSLSR